MSTPNDKTLFRTLYGSRLYGTYLSTSDHDYKSVYLPDIHEMLFGTIFKNAPDGEILVEGKFIQEERIPVQRLLTDFYQGQTYAMELVWATKLFLIRRRSSEQEVFIEMCEDLRHCWLNRNTRVMAGYARGQAMKYSQKGKRLEAAEALRSILATHNARNSTIKLVNAPDLIGCISELSDEYPDHLSLGTYDITKNEGIMKPCIRFLGKVLPYSITVEHALVTVNAVVSEYGSRARQAMEASGKDWKAIAHAIRIAQQGIDLHLTGDLLLPFQKGEGWCDYLREVRNGQVPMDQAVEQMERRLTELAALEAKSQWPDSDDESRVKQFHEWCLSVVSELYDINFDRAVLLQGVGPSVPA